MFPTLVIIICARSNFLKPFSYPKHTLVPINNNNINQDQSGPHVH